MSSANVKSVNILQPTDGEKNSRKEKLRLLVHTTRRQAEYNKG